MVSKTPVHSGGIKLHFLKFSYYTGVDFQGVDDTQTFGENWKHYTLKVLNSGWNRPLWFMIHLCFLFHNLHLLEVHVWNSQTGDSDCYYPYNAVEDSTGAIGGLFCLLPSRLAHSWWWHHWDLNWSHSRQDSSHASSWSGLPGFPIQIGVVWAKFRTVNDLWRQWRSPQQTQARVLESLS